MGEEANKAVVRRFFEIANNRDYSQLEELVATDFVRHCEATPDVKVQSRDDFVAFCRQSDATFPNSVGRVDMLVAEGDLVAFWGSYSGTQDGPMGPFPASGRWMTSDMGGVFQVENGMISRLWVTWDNLAVLTQLGHFPPPGE